MDFQYKLIVSNQVFYKEFEIPVELERVKLGSTSNCEFRLNPENFFEDIEITFEKKENWNILCCDNLYISRGDVRKLLFSELIHDDVISICYANSEEVAFEIRFLIDFGADGTDYSLKIDLSQISELNIGDKSSANIELSTEYGKDTFVSIVHTNNGIELLEKNSKYGTYLNGKRINKKALLRDFDFISVADFSAYYKDKQLYFSKKNIRLNEIGQMVEQVDISDAYPMFVRNTRIKVKCDEKSIKILDPPSIPTKPELNIATSLLPTIAMFALVVVLRGILSSTGGTFVLFSICSMGLGVITSIISIVEKKKKYKADCEKRIMVYSSYIENKKKEIEDEREKEVQCLKKQYYNTEQDLEHIERFNSCLFDRTPEDEDFLDVYLGSGTIKSKKIIDYKLQEKLEVGDDWSEAPGELANEYEYLHNAPIVAKLKNANAIGIVGESVGLYEMLKVMLVDIISRHYYGEVLLYALLDEGQEKYDWLKLLPHIQGSDKCRNIVCDSESKSRVFENLYKELDARSKKEIQSGYNVILVMKEWGIKGHPVSKFIEKASDLNTVFIFFEKKIDLLPLHCDKIIQIEDENQAELYDVENKEDSKKFVFNTVSDIRLKKAINILAPVFCEEISLESSLRKNISLFEVLGIYNVNDLRLTERWQKSKIYDSMAVPLGVNAKEDVVYLDLHENFHGPHGLVAGTTGSGKSEILQTYILGAATLFHPYEIGFVIIDFKGGGMVNQFKKLPHLIGAITNIDGKAINRSLKSIKAELLKRQSLFAEMGVNHIDKYIKVYKEGKAKIALPHLVIIVDEFAELKAEQPEFMKELISAARIGRSLGVHLILATQKPAGQVNDQIWSNSKFKLCLKVQTQEDSNEVLKSPLAAEIREPGRAYLQVGNNEVFELLQSGFSGCPEKSDGNKAKAYDISSLDFKGNRTLVYRQKPKKNVSSRTQLEAVVDYVDSYCKKQNIIRLPEICLPELWKCINREEVGGAEKNLEMRTIIGIYDDPDHQYQGNANIEIGTANTLIIGSSQFGKTNLIETIISNLSEVYTPDEINIYIIDFASMVLKNFENLAHVGGVVTPSDDEKLKNLFKYLSEQIIFRKERLLSVGVSSYMSYKEAGYIDIPQIVVFVDNMTVLKELYLQDNDVLLNLCREGNSVGMSFVIANAQTAGLGYKYLANFATRIALFCNEPSEYSSVFGACRIRPDELPGRCVLEVDKTLYECQTLLAFKGDKEIDRVRAMQIFVEEINKKYGNRHAIPIPEIPNVLSEKYIFEKFTNIEKNKHIVGLGYDSVMPIVMDMSKTNMLALSGAADRGKSNYISYFVHSMLKKYGDMDIFIFDDYKKKLSTLAEQVDNVFYELRSEECKDALLNIDLCMQNRYQELISGQEISGKWEVLIINNEEVITQISNDKIMLAQFKNIIGKYHMLKVYVILGEIPNVQVVYGAPEIYKLVKESRHILFFDDLDNCKLIDIPLTIVRNNKKKIKKGDAYYINGNECHKVKTPLSVN